MNHTKGPWTVIQTRGSDEELPRLIITAKGKMAEYFELATIPLQTFEDKDNFNLISAAPDMLEALEEILNEFTNEDRVKELAIAAIKKAKGEI